MCTLIRVYRSFGLCFARPLSPAAATDVIKETHQGQDGRSDDDDDLHPECRPPYYCQHKNGDSEQETAETEIHGNHLLPRELFRLDRNGGICSRKKPILLQNFVTCPSGVFERKF